MRIVTVENIYNLSNPNSTPGSMILTVFDTKEVACGIIYITNIEIATS